MNCEVIVFLLNNERIKRQGGVTQKLTEKSSIGNDAITIPSAFSSNAGHGKGNILSSRRDAGVRVATVERELKKLL